MFVTPQLVVPPTSLSYHTDNVCKTKHNTRLLTACASPPQIWICTGPSCTTDGSSNTIDIINAITPPSIAACPTGCLGECGSGPNATAISSSIAVPTITKRLRTAHSVKTFLNSIGCQVEPANFDAAELKETADTKLQAGNAAAAADLYSKAATVLQQTGSLYVSILCNWSAALVESGQPQEALQVANWAVDAETSRPAAWRRKAQAHEACKQIDSAVSAWTVVGRLSGQPDEAKRNVRRLKRPGFFRF